MQKIYIRQATSIDLEHIIPLIQQAQTYFSLQGIDQWQNNYPVCSDIQQDILNQEAYVVLHNNETIAYFMLTFKPESTYNLIEHGKWLTQNSTYAVLHRIAVANKAKGQGIVNQIFNFAILNSTKYHASSIRIDTHAQNKNMLSAIKKASFTHCGTIYVTDGSARLAFEKLI